MATIRKMLQQEQKTSIVKLLGKVILEPYNLVQIPTLPLAGYVGQMI